MSVRPIGVFVITDEKGRDEKVLCVPVEDPPYSTYRTLDEMAPHFLREIEHFFSVCKDLEGKRTGHYPTLASGLTS